VNHSRHMLLAPFVSRLDLARDHAAAMLAAGVPASAFADVTVGTLGQCRIICAREGAELRWHLSISHPFRLPTWDEINAARDACIPADVWLCQPMPPKDYWVNLHPHTLHLWQVRDRELIAQWAYDGCGDGERADAVAALACAPTPTIPKR
jgi:hypothetical protein